MRHKKQILHSAGVKASELAQEHEGVIDAIISFYKTDSIQRTHPDYKAEQQFWVTPSGASSYQCKPFEKFTTAQARTWKTLESEATTATASQIDKIQHNILGFILTKNDETFLKEIEFKACEGEMGHLLVQRLKSIVKTLPRASIYLKRYLSGAPGTLLHYHKNALQDEIQKLLYHSFTHPKNKQLLLGTARSVEASSASFRCDAIYLNCPENLWTWELNRVWLKVALDLGYEIKLVEQHFPNIEEAILSGNPAKLVVELAREIRSSDQTSQYNGEDQPTATCQEILALLDMGCVAKKNHDGSLSLYSSLTHLNVEENQQNEKINLIPQLLRSHSFPHLFKNAPPPPLKTRSENFARPEDSPQIRQKFVQ